MIDEVKPFILRFLRLEVVALVLVVTVIASPASTMTVEDLAERSIKARGGIKKLRSVQSMRMRGQFAMYGMEGSVTMMMKRPGRVRMDMTSQGMTLVQIFDGEDGWLLGREGPVPLPTDQIEQMRDQADFDGPLVDYKKKGNQLRLMGREGTDGIDAYKVEVTKPSGAITQVYLDARTYLEIRTDDRLSMEGIDIESHLLQGDYRKVNGMMLPHTLEFGAKGSPIVQKITVEAWELNLDLPDSLFAMPPGRRPATATADSAGSGKAK